MDLFTGRVLLRKSKSGSLLLREAVYMNSKILLKPVMVKTSLTVSLTPLI